MRRSLNETIALLWSFTFFFSVRATHVTSLFNKIPNFHIENNTLTGGSLLTGFFTGDWKGFSVNGNTFLEGSRDSNLWQAPSAFGLWTNNIRSSERTAGTVISTSENQVTVTPFSDLTVLEWNPHSGGADVQVASYALGKYPLGFTKRTLWLQVFSVSNCWRLPPPFSVD